jgi:hypothetical protein
MDEFSPPGVQQVHWLPVLRTGWTESGRTGHEPLDIAVLLRLMARNGAEPRLSAPKFV